MRTATRVSPGTLEHLATKLYLLWAGLAIGVAFLATPAKFLAPSLSLTVALDVGRHTFRIYNTAEVMLVLILLTMGAGARRRRRWYLSLLVPALVVIAQALWLIPALDHRVSAILAGQSPAPSGLHTVYIAAEGLKVLWLLAMGLGAILLRPSTHDARLDRGSKGTGWFPIVDNSSRGFTS